MHMMQFLAEDLREQMAALGYRTVDQMVGHGEHLKPRYVPYGKAKTLNYDRMLGKTVPIARKKPIHLSRNMTGRIWIGLLKPVLNSKMPPRLIYRLIMWIGRLERA